MNLLVPWKKEIEQNFYIVKYENNKYMNTKKITCLYIFLDKRQTDIYFILINMCKMGMQKLTLLIFVVMLA